ncbi:tetratricopeptide repeat protein [Desulfobacter hydrogenophilus]|nr:tetratricopeptide repeat protein [Desulfobacter hydrogenophilus]NDY73814.1 tetratricopeptide repeat protein [Desulfobacter hydrogenophilus]
MKKKIIGFGGVFFISVIIAGMALAGIVFYSFLDHLDGKVGCFEQNGDDAYTDSAYSQALQCWLNIPEEDRTAVLCGKIGNAYLKLSNLDQAILFFEMALKKNPLNMEIQKQIIRILLLKGNMAKAEKMLSKLKSRAASEPDVLLLSGDLFLLKGDIERAKMDYTLAMDFSPGKIRPKIKLAICLVQQQKKIQAEKIITNVVFNQLEKTSDILLVADYHILANDTSKAEEFIQKAALTDPGNLDIKIRLYRFYRSNGMLVKATQYLKILVAQYPDNAGFKLMSADICLSNLDVDGAQKWLDKANELKGDDTGYQLLMGKFWMFQGGYSHAVSYLKTALERNYGLVSAHYLLGIAYLAGGQSKFAETSLVRALMIDPNHVDALLAMAGLHYKNKDYALALQYIDWVLSLDSSESTAWQVRGLCLMEKGEYKTASQAFSRAWHLGGGASALFFLACSFEGQKLYQAALDTYESVFEKKPDMVEALYYYAWLMADTGKGGQALERIDLWLKKGNAFPGVYYAGAKISLALKNYSKCKTYINKAMADKPVSGKFYLLQADLLRAKQEYTAMEDTLLECTREQPLFLEGWRFLAAYYMEKHEIGSAKEVLEKALKHFPDEPEIMGNLAWLLLEEGTDSDRALEYARNAYEQIPNQAWLMDTLGWAYYHKNAFSQAEWMLSQAEEKAPDNGSIQYHLGMTFYKQGKLLKAKEKFESAFVNNDINESEKEKINTILLGLNGHKKEKNNSDIIILDTDEYPALEFPEDPDQKEDTLKPDWGNMRRS